MVLVGRDGCRNGKDHLWGGWGNNLRGHKGNKGIDNSGKGGAQPAKEVAYADDRTH